MCWVVVHAYKNAEAELIMCSTWVFCVRTTAWGAVLFGRPPQPQSSLKRTNRVKERKRERNKKVQMEKHRNNHTERHRRTVDQNKKEKRIGERDTCKTENRKETEIV